ncbi:MAG: hypothetical protein R3F30_01745 [Planctomycetota bacterium]
MTAGQGSGAAIAHNLGYAAGNNLLARRPGGDVLCLLNSDTEVGPARSRH